jgi:glutamyl-tRNA synthetase
VTTGRFAPSPTADLHIGNLRTALLAWLFARSATGGTPPERRPAVRGGFIMRVEDLDPAARRSDISARQLADVAALGIDWDGEVVCQSDRFDLYHRTIDQLTAAGLTYPCWCSRREVAEAATAPNEPGMPEGAYPGTCASLDSQARRAKAGTGRRPALRLRAHKARITVHDMVCGEVTGVVDDFVIRRADGVPAYNLAVVVDDADQGVDQVVRGDDLLGSTPRQVLLHQLLGMKVPGYAHVPLVLSPGGGRMAKRGAGTTLGELTASGMTPDDVVTLMAVSLGLAQPGERITAAMVLDRFDPHTLPGDPWHFTT